MSSQLPRIIIVVVLLLSLQITSLNAFPGKGIAEHMRATYAHILFLFHPYESARNTLLDDAYLKYFTANSEKLSEIFALEIAFYSQFYMICVKIGQNEEKLEQLKVPRSNNSLLFDLSYTLRRILIDYRRKNNFVAVCLLARARYELSKALNDAAFEEKPSWPSCAIEKNAKKVIEEIHEEIAEIMLNDLMLSFYERKKLIKYLNGLAAKNDQNEIEKACGHLIGLVGYSRASLLCRTFEQEFGILCVRNGKNDNFYLLYESFFSNNSTIGKWRSKMILEVFLYKECAVKFFKNKIRNQITKEVNETDPMLIAKYHMKAQFMYNICNYWDFYSDNFWLKEKVLRNVTFRLVKDSENKMNKLKEMLRKGAKYRSCHTLSFAFLPCDEQMPFLWEEGPTDVSLFRALKICTTEVVEEYMRKFDTTKLAALEEMELTQLAKFILCMGKHLKKNNAQKNDEEMAKLHKNKMANLLETEGNGDEFGELLNKNKKKWQILLDSDGKAKIEELLSDYEFLTASEESFNSSASENDDDQLYFDAKIGEINEGNGNKKKKKEIGEIREEKTPTKEKAKILDEKNYEIKNDKKANEKPTQEVVEIDRKFEINEEILEINAKNDLWIQHSQYKKTKSKKKNGKRKKDFMLEHQKKEGANSDKNENNSENQIKFPKPKGSVKGDEKFSINSPKNLKQKSENVCLKALNKMGIYKMEDLMGNNFLSNLYKKYFEDKLDEECVPFLHISLFGRAIETKRNFIERNTKNKILEEFNEKWAKFIGTNLDKFDTVQFLIDKLFFVHNELDKLGNDPQNEQYLNKAFEILEANELIKLEKSAEFKSETRQTMPIQRKDETNRQIITQFGPYQSEELSQILAILHTQAFSALVKKKLQKNADLKEAIETECQNEQNYPINMERQNFLCERVENLIKSVEGTEMMIKQQKIGNLPADLEFFPYNLIRTTKAIREAEIQRSNELIQFIAPFEMDQNKKDNVFNLKHKIELIIGDWAKKFGSIKYQLLVAGSFLLGTELDGSDLDLLCVVPNEIKVDNFNGPNADSLYEILKKTLNKARISCISGSIELLRIETETIEIDLCFVPVPKNYLQQNGQLLQNKIVEEMDYEPGISPLAGYRSAQFQLSLLSDRHKEFANLLKIVKIWTQARLIYSGIFGYFNGVTLSIMATKICLLFPNAPLSFLLLQFFSVYSKWDWSRVSIMLDQMTPITLNKIVWQWPPFIGQNPMTVITPKFPEQNTSYNVNKFTLRTIVDELALANEVLSKDPKNWKAIFKKIKIEENFENFAVIVSSVSQWENLSAMCALQRSKIRIHLLEWANSAKVADKLDHYQLMAKKEQKLRCKMLRPSFCCYWLVGLRLKAKKMSADLIPIYAQNLMVPAFFGNYMISSFYSKTENVNKLFRELKLEEIQ